MEENAGARAARKREDRCLSAGRDRRIRRRLVFVACGKFELEVHVGVKSGETRTHRHVRDAALERARGSRAWVEGRSAPRDMAGAGHLDGVNGTLRGFD